MPTSEPRRRDLGTSLRRVADPAGRAAVYRLRYLREQMRAVFPGPRGSHRQPVFLIGCGRSGTSLLGELLSLHPDVDYRFEPYASWAALDPRSDFVHWYTRRGDRVLMDASDVTATSRRKFERLFLGRVRGDRVLVEKSPVNSLRVGYLLALAPNGKFVHIVRDGVEVARSIAKIAGASRSIAGLSSINDWWGIDDVKWRLLARDGAAAGYWPEMIGYIDDHRTRGAYEWLVSLSEVDAWRGTLGEALLEIRYEDLIRDAGGALERVGAFLALRRTTAWPTGVVTRVRASREGDDDEIALPEEMTEAFNRCQERFGFRGRAVPLQRAEVR